MLLKTVAGRACSPFGFGRMIASDVTVGPACSLAALAAPLSVSVNTGVFPTLAIPDP